MTVLRFADFELDTHQRRLKKEDAIVRVGARAFDILSALASRANEVIPKDELINQVWPDTIVSDGALRVHLAGLRKAMGPDAAAHLIQNIPGRGYVFSGDVVSVLHDGTAPALNTDLSLLPTEDIRLFGRDNFIEACLQEPVPHILTIVGAGGIGKTTVAAHVVRRMGSDFDQVLIVDLGSLTDRGRLAASVASRLGLSSYGDNPLPGVIRWLGHRHVLMLVDNCEHLIDECAGLLETLVSSCPNIRIVATSREPLRIDAEVVRRLGPLETPFINESSIQTASFPSVELFVDRASLSLGQTWTPNDSELVTIGHIVRKLDGIPLAIELAAARIVDLGLTSLLSSLDRPLSVLRRGRRTAPPRQQTLRATLDWSYQILSHEERKLLMLLSIFANSFRVQAAAGLADRFLSKAEFEDAITGLVAKSLVVKREASDRLRLLETTRDYASCKLNESSFADEARMEHAKLLCDRLNKSEAEWDHIPANQWLEAHGNLIDDLRTALTWASQRGLTELFLVLAANSGLIWTQLGLMREQLDVVIEALGYLDGGETDPALETVLRSSYGGIAYNVHSSEGDEEAVRQFELAASAAERMGDQAKILRAYSGICAVLTTQGQYRAADALAWKVDRLLGESAKPYTMRIAAHNAHYLGRHADAMKFAELALVGQGSRVKGTSTSGASFGQRLLALMVMAKTAWITGAASSSYQIIEDAVGEALDVDHAISACLVLSVGACPIYLGSGLDAEARHHLNLLHHISVTNSLIRWQEWAEGFELKAAPGLVTDRQSVLAALARGANGPRLENTAVVVGADIGLGLINLALTGEAGWCEPELLRIKGEALISSRQAGEVYIRRGLDLAIEQGAVLWELRCAISLVEFGGQSTRQAGKLLIESTLRKFSQTPPLRDLQNAERILNL